MMAASDPVPLLTVKSDAELLIETCEHARILTMNRSDKRNALNNTLTAALIEGLRAPSWTRACAAS